jgi:hypothetical protein
MLLSGGMSSRFIRLLLLFLLAFLAVSGKRTIHRNTSQTIAFQQLPLVTEGKAPARIGALKFISAWELRSDNQNFGGFSALTVLRDGRFLGISDAGTMIGFDPPGTHTGAASFIAALPSAFGAKVNYQYRDSEGIASDPESGRLWISYEGKAAIRRMPPSFSRIDGINRTAALRAWDGNSAGEAIARLRDGRFLLFSEGQDRSDDSFQALMFSGDPVEPDSDAIGFGYRPPAGFKPTEALQLPGGQVLILNRRIGFPEGFSAKLTLINPTEIAADETIKGRVIATLTSPLLVDNMEGMTLTEENGQAILWMISDNNFNIFQRTLLMKFALILPNKKPAVEETTPGFESL